MQTRKYRLKYEVDPLNRLVVTLPSGGMPSRRRKLVLEGEFTTDKNNTLMFNIRTPEPELKRFLPGPPQGQKDYRVKFEGTWSLTPEGALKLSLAKSAGGARGNYLVLKTGIISASSGELIFSLRSKESNNSWQTRMLKLSGHWEIAPGNRLKFAVTRKRHKPDSLLFSAAWEVGKNYEITYRGERARLKTKTSRKGSFSLKGTWQIHSRRQLVFLVEGDDRSRLDIKAMLQTPSIRAKKGEIRYRAGIGLRSGRRVGRYITFFGKWRINRDLSIDFEVRSGRSLIQTFHFKAGYSPDRKSKVTFSLKDDKGKGLGMEVTFTRDFFKSAEAFIRLRSGLQEKAVEAGVRIPF